MQQTPWEWWWYPLHCHDSWHAISCSGVQLCAYIIQGACDFHLRPATVAAIICLTFACLVWVVLSAAVRGLRIYSARRGSTFVAVASSALRELQAASPDSRLPRLHEWFTPPPINAPVVCCGCYQPVLPAAQAQCCELCGVVCHAQCTRTVPHNCKPWASLAQAPQHDWRPAGTLTESLQDVHTQGAAVSLAPELCLYCGQPCEVGLFAVEPVWTCTGCSRLAHCQCYVDLHPGPFSAATKAALSCQAAVAGVGEDPPIAGSSPRARARRAVVFEEESEQEGEFRLVAGPSIIKSSSKASLKLLQQQQQTPALTMATNGPAGALGLPPKPPSSHQHGQTLPSTLQHQHQQQHQHTNIKSRSTSFAQAHAHSSQPASPPSPCLDVGKASLGLSQGTSSNRRRAKKAAAAAAAAVAEGCASLAAAPSSSDFTSVLSKGHAAMSRGNSHAHISGGHSNMNVNGGGQPHASRAAADAAAAAAASAEAAAAHANSHRKCFSMPDMSEAGWAGMHGDDLAAAPVNGGVQQGFHPGHHHPSLLHSSQASHHGANQPAPPPHHHHHLRLVREGSISDEAGGPDSMSLHHLSGMRPPPLVTAATWELNASQVAALDVCHYGVHGKLVLPPTAVRLVHDATHAAAPTLVPALNEPAPGRGGLEVPPAAVEEAAEEIVKQGPKEAACDATKPLVALPPAAPALSAAAAAAGASATSSAGGLASGMRRRKSSSGRGERARRAGKRWWSGAARPVAKWRDYRIDVLPPGVRPLLAFVNLKSGPQVGGMLRRQLLQLLHPLQVVELPRESPDTALACWARVPHLRLLVLGGDGTVGWVLGCLDRLALSMAEAGEADWQRPPVAIVPMGTGNDLARCLKWGAGLSEVRRNGLPHCLLEVAAARVVLMDRWNVAITRTPPPPKRRLAGLASSGGSGGLTPTSSLTGPSLASGPSTSAASGSSSLTELKVLNNYLGVGIDAQCALEFHAMRNRYPGWFTSQMGNKLWYTGVGAVDIVGRTCVDLPKKLTIVADGVVVDIPAHIQGILFLNISSFMGGVEPWENGLPALSELSYSHAATSSEQHLPVLFNDDDGGHSGGGGGRFGTGDGSGYSGAAQLSVPAGSGGMLRQQSLNDGLIELVGVNSSVHLGQLQVGLARAQRLCQCRTVTLTTRAPVQMQIDGEPWVQPPASLTITLRGTAPMLERLDVDRLPTSVSLAVAEALDASEAAGIINNEQRRLLAAELNDRLSRQ